MLFHNVYKMVNPVCSPKMVDIDIYSFGSRPVQVMPTYRLFRFAPAELEYFARQNWLDNHKGWKSSFVPNVEKIVADPDGKLTIPVSTSNYADQFGAIVAIQEGKEFAPKGVSGLAIATYTKTVDGKIILPRRSAKLKHSPLVYNTFCGWMSTMNSVGKEKCEDLRSALDERLYDPYWQAGKEFMEESRLEEGTFELSRMPASMIRGYRTSFNPSLGYFGKINKTAAQVQSTMLKIPEEEFAPGRTEMDKIAAVHVDDLEGLLRNQPELYKEDPAVYQPTDVKGRDLILVDSILGGLYHHFTELVGKERPPGLGDHLRRGGITINTIEIHPGQEYFL